ncbi:MAG: AEC family transporter [Oscillospiraceae bacterium]|nr:AEC family transporter [Oscillospiraceae bacterium]
MENLLFSLNSTVPLFLVMVVGYLLRRKGMLNEGFCDAAEKFNYNVTLPALLIRDLSGVDIYGSFDLKFILYCALATVGFFGLTWIGAKLFIKEKESVGGFVQASCRSSAAVLGIALIQNMYGTSGMAPMMIIGAVPLFNIISVLALTLENPANKGHGALKKAIINIFKNPIILAIFAGMALSLLRVDFPVMIDKTIGSIASLASPLALIVIGATFEFKGALGKLRLSVVASFLKLIAIPAVFLVIAALCGFRDEKMVAIMVMLCGSTTPSCYIMAKNMGGDYELSSSVIVITTLASAFTLTFWIWALRSLGYI